MGRLLVLNLLLIIPKTTASLCSIYCYSSFCGCGSRVPTSVPQDLPTTITGLYLWANDITTVTDFSRYSSLTRLELQNNQISTIYSGAFYSLTRLTYLNLGYNQLTSLRADMFMGLDSLRYLYLDHNRINNFPESPSLLNIVKLRMDYNQIETLSSAAYEILASISYVQIQNNSWQCDCWMLPFKQRMNGSYPFENQTTCAGPADLAGKSLLFEVNPEDLICDATQSLHLISGFLGVVVGILLTLAVVLVIWCKRRKRKTSPAPDPDTPQDTTKNRDQACPDVTETGAAESDDVERALDPDPYDLDLGYRLVRPSLPPIAGTSLS